MGIIIVFRVSEGDSGVIVEFSFALLLSSTPMAV